MLRISGLGAGPMRLLGLAAIATLMLSAWTADRAEAMTPINPTALPAAKAASDDMITQVRHGGGGGHGGHGGGFHGGGAHFGGFRAAPAFHGGGYRYGGYHRYGGYRPVYYGHHHHFHRRYYYGGYYPYYPSYHYPRRCRIIWTYYGPRRVCRWHRWHRWHHWHHPYRYW